jgi:membrane peptidoglycan carboxypeptidase
VTPTPPQISYIYASDNKTLIATIYDENRHVIPLAQVPQVMRDAMIAAEDQRFYQHHGVDFQGVIRAMVANQQTDSNQGASTLTMQYVRQALTYGSSSPEAVIAATEQTNVRKLREIKLALQLETELTKDEILERYLNIAAFGNGTYGIYAASQVYFNKVPAKLTLEEAALLAGLVKAPSAYDPTDAKGLKAALARRGYVLDQMYKNGMITKEVADATQTKPIKVSGKRTPNGCVSTTKNQWGFFCDYLVRWWQQQDFFGADSSSREANLKAGGYRIVTSLDIKIQTNAKKNVGEATQDRQLRRPHAGGDRARHRAHQGDGGQPQLRPAGQQERAVDQPGQAQAGHQGHLPHHDQPAHQRRRGHHRVQGRFHLQDLYDGGRAGEGVHPRLPDPRPVAVPVQVRGGGELARRLR